MLELRELLDWVVAGLVAIVTWVMRGIHQRQRDYEARIRALEISVSGKYVTRAEMQATLSEINRKLDGLRDRLDAKADK